MTLSSILGLDGLRAFDEDLRLVVLGPHRGSLTAKLITPIPHRLRNPVGNEIAVILGRQADVGRVRRLSM